MIMREPVGVVAAITPWSMPLNQIIAKVVPAVGAVTVNAYSYRAGAEYLLLLRRRMSRPNMTPNELSLYWARLSATNEQLFGGASDPWFIWVSQHQLQLKR